MSESTGGLKSLRWQDVVTYVLEVRDMAGIAADYYFEIWSAATEWLEIHERLRRHAQSAVRSRARDEQAANDYARSARLQRTIFSATEAMLTAHARVSLLLFPSGSLGTFTTEEDEAIARARRRWRIKRGKMVRRGIGLDKTHSVADRKHRDYWMHFDERLDTAMQRDAMRPQPQKFAESRDVDEKAKRSYTRLFEIRADRVLLYLGGELYDLLDVANTLADVFQRATAHQQLRELIVVEADEEVHG